MQGPDKKGIESGNTFDDKKKEKKESEKKDKASQNKDRSNKSKFKHNKGSKGFKRNRSHRGSQSESYDKPKNDLTWYAPNEQIARDLGNVPYSGFNGAEYTFTNRSLKEMKTGPITNPRAKARNISPVVTATIPGVFVYKYIPNLGRSGATSAVNIAAKAVYSWVRHANSGRANYESVDLMLYIGAMDSIYLRVHELKRVFRLVQTYVMRNRDIPKNILLALGVDIQDTIQNLAAYRARFNVLISKINTLAVPNTFKLFDRRALLGSIVLTDDKDRPTQLIVPKTDGFYNYSATAYNTGGALVWADTLHLTQDTAAITDDPEVVLSGMRFSVGNLLNQLDNAISILLADEDINIMSGDIIKAYGSELYKLPLLAEEEIQEFTYDVDLLQQFKNSVCVEVPGATINQTSNAFRFRLPTDKEHMDWTGTLPVIGQVGNNLVFDMMIGNDAINTDPNTDDKKRVALAASMATATMSLQNIIIDSYVDEFDPKMTLEWTRLVSFVNDNGVVIAGTEIGIGWLYRTNFTEITTTNGESVENLLVTAQWFQFGAPRVVDSIVKVSSNKTTTTQILVGLGFKNGKVATKSTPLNRICIDAAVRGLNWGPRSYTMFHCTAEKTAGNVPISYEIHLLPFTGKFGAKTAFIAKENVSNMHDAAFLGLLGSQFLK